MTLSIKGGGGIINEVPKVSNLRVTAFETETIDIEYKVEDIELTICRHYLLLNEAKTEITKQVGYESSTNVFRYKITGLEMGRTYTIQIAASDGHDEGLSKAVQQATKNAIIYGVRVMENNSNPETCCTYIEEAVEINLANSTSLGGWSKIYPFNEIKIIGLKNGVETNEINPLNKDHYFGGYRVPDDVDVMVKIPKVYWKFSNISNGYELRISKDKFDGADCYAHKVNGAEKDYIYVGAYLGYVENGKLRSKSRATPTTNKTIGQFRQYAQANGDGYQQWNWYTQTLIQILYLIAYKNLNSQQALGYGFVYGSGYPLQTGGTYEKGFVYGESSGRQQMCFLGIEDLWGNLSQWVDGLKISNTSIMATPNNKIFNDNGSGYKKIGTAINTTNVYINKVFHDNECAFLTKECNGSETTHYTDAGAVWIGGDNVGAYGGNYTVYRNAGIFNFYANYNTSLYNSEIGSRLCYLG